MKNSQITYYCIGCAHQAPTVSFTWRTPVLGEFYYCGWMASLIPNIIWSAVAKTNWYIWNTVWWKRPYSTYSTWFSIHVSFIYFRTVRAFIIACVKTYGPNMQSACKCTPTLLQTDTICISFIFDEWFTRKSPSISHPCLSVKYLMMSLLKYGRLQFKLNRQSSLIRFWNHMKWSSTIHSGCNDYSIYNRWLWTSER